MWQFNYLLTRHVRNYVLFSPQHQLYFLWMLVAELRYKTAALFTTHCRVTSRHSVTKIMAACATEIWQFLRRLLWAGKGQLHTAAAGASCRQQAGRPSSPEAAAARTLIYHGPTEARFSRTIRR